MVLARSRCCDRNSQVTASNRERVGSALELVGEGLAPFVNERMKGAAPKGTNWGEAVAARFGVGHQVSLTDPHFQLRVMWEFWNEIFGKVLQRSDRTQVSILMDARNAWAHNNSFTFDDTYRALDAAQSLLSAVGAEVEAGAVKRSRDEVLRQRYEEEARKSSRALPGGGTAVAGLQPWREVIVPHPDVRSGGFVQAEFAANLWQVFQQEAAPEYQDPVEFFRRTYLTDGLRQLLTDALRRVADKGGAPVVELQTTFGGGKTHALLALYHLFSGVPASQFSQEIQDLISKTDVAPPAHVKRVVLACDRIPPGQLVTKRDGTVIHTLWGEIAWQLGGTEGYALVAESDQAGTSPGAFLDEALRRFGPAAILIDEWVAYARQLYHAQDLPAGSFDAHFTFAQALTEAVQAVPGCLLVISIPQSEDRRLDSGPSSEVGGPGGREALSRLRLIVGRVESPWRPATSDESFEIVRRRLFQPLEGPESFAARDATARAFGDMYRRQPRDFPSECREESYLARIKAAYPIHPELFDRLYQDWSTLERFQRTRGVLRLMAAVIHSLWTSEDKAPLILPGTFPLHESVVSTELTRYLDDNWKPILDRDVDGSNSTPQKLDADHANLGRFGAARRAARSIFLGSAPTLGTANRGVDEARIHLACAFPTDPTDVFSDALRRLASASTYLYSEGHRYWYDTQASVTKTASERRQRYLEQQRDELVEELKRRIRENTSGRSARGGFGAVHVAPDSSAEVPDEDDSVRLVILGPDVSHTAKSPQSMAAQAALEFLDRRGAAPRLYGNLLLFVSADGSRLEELLDSVAEFLAWNSIDQQMEELGLLQQRRQIETRLKDADQTANLRLAEAYLWILAPIQPDQSGPRTLQFLRASGEGTLAARAYRKLKDSQLVNEIYSPILLRRELDRIPLWRGDHISAGELWDHLARYTYLPRLRDREVLYGAIAEAPRQLIPERWQEESFAVATAYDEASGRYLGLLGPGDPSGSAVTPSTLLVQTERAMAQLASAAAPAGPFGADKTPSSPSDSTAAASPPPRRLRRFHASLRRDPLRAARDAGVIADEIIQRLVAVPGASVRVSVEIEGETPDGFPAEVERAVSENASTLKASPFGFTES